MKSVLPKFLFRISLILFLILQVQSQPVENSNQPAAQEEQIPSQPQPAQTDNEEKKLYELDVMLTNLFCPSQSAYEVQAWRLKHQLLKILREKIKNFDDILKDNYQSLEENSFGAEYDKRSYRSLLRDGFPKRSVAALARAGLLRPNDLYDFEPKRSIATLAKNGQLPSREPDTDIASTSWTDGEKRSVASLARSGYISGKRNIQSLARQYEFPYVYGGKRSIVSLIRNRMLPSISPKRNVASLARAGTFGKRNIATLARDRVLPKSSQKFNEKREFDFEQDEEKRNIQSLKNSISHGRKKRGIDEDEYTDTADFNLSDLENGEDEYMEPVMQTEPFNYQELVKWLQEAYPYNMNDEAAHLEDKRFLGSIARSGWFRYGGASSISKRHIGALARMGFHGGTSSLSSPPQQRQQQEKRHIGALARSGWIPSFRPVRGGRFSRSGRARSQIVEFYYPQERLRQPIAAVCRRCDNDFTNTINKWNGIGTTTWGSTPPRVTALHWRNYREPTTLRQKW